MIYPFILRRENPGKGLQAPASRTLVLPEVQPEAGRGITVRQVFTYFHNLNLRVLIDDLRRGRVARGNWSFAEDLCPVSHGLPNGHTVGLLRYLSQAVDLPRACRAAAEETGVPARFLERFVVSWDSGSMSLEWLLDQLEAIWAERLADAEAVQTLLDGRPARQGGPA